MGEARGPLETLLTAGTAAGMTDGQLLARFVARGAGDEAAEVAFSALVRRHGPMVWGVCRRLLGDRHAAEDAFQATFLVLARRAGSVRRPDRLGPWLYGVAIRTVREATARDRRRRRQEALALARAVEAAGSAGRDGGDDDPGFAAAGREAAATVHEEVARLPRRDREAVVLCDLQGLTREEAARRLGCPPGTVGARLSRARVRLRDRLARRGLAPSAAWPVAPALPDRVAGLAASGRLRLVMGPSILAKGVLRAMIFEQLRTAALLVTAAAALGLGAAALVRPSPAAQAPGAPKPAAEGKPGPAADDRATIAALEKRLADLEKKVADLAGAGPGAPARPPGVDPDSILKVRVWFNARVERVHARPGQKVKKGDPLFGLYSIDLARAKSDLQTKYVQWQHDLRLSVLRQKLVETGAISQQLWVDTQGAEQKSRLEYKIALDNLRVFYEVPPEEIDPLIEGLSDKVPDPRAFEAVSDKARMTLRSPADGTVFSCQAGLGELVDPKTVLMEIATARP
jgi:RNA polymerase sigma factor (sigma-70 family)